MTILEEGEFQRWKDHPLTQDFLQICRDRRDYLALSWARGLTGAESPALQAEAILLDQLAEINFDTIQQLAGVASAGEVLSDDDSM